MHLTSAGYTRYDTPALREALRRRGGADDQFLGLRGALREHAFSFMLALARQLPQMLIEQQTDRSLASAEHRLRSRLLTGQTALLYGYGTIASRRWPNCSSP